MAAPGKTFRERLIWCAAFLEGEGYFTASPRYNGRIDVGASQVYPQVLRWLHDEFGGTFHQKKYKDHKWVEQTVWTVRGMQAVGVMMMLYPFMSEHRRGQIRTAIDRWHSWGVMSSRKVTCRDGHPLDGTDYRGKRYCVTCKRKYWREWSQKDRANRPEHYRTYWRERRTQLKVVG